MNTKLEFSDQPVIQTRRLILRKPALPDAENVASCLNDFEVAKMLVRVPWPESLEGAIWWINQWIESRQDGWCFSVNETAEPTSLIGVVSVEPKDETYEMGWWLNQRFWGKGYMTEAVGAVVHHARLVNPNVVIGAGAISDNPASLRIQEKLGFEITGVEQVHCISRNETVDVIKTRLR